MNIVNKVYCRVFQKCFHVAIPILPYRTPKILDSVKDVPAELKARKVSKVLVVTDSFIGKSRGMELLKSYEKYSTRSCKCCFASQNA